MKKNTGKLYKLFVLILGVFGLVGSGYLAYIQSSSITSLRNNDILQLAAFLKLLIFFWLIILTICMLLYGIGIIIEILQSINDNLNLSISGNEKKDISNLEQNDELLQWKRPV